MVKINMSGEAFFKIVYWGCAGSGKTTIVDTLHKLTTEKIFDRIKPTGEITKIAKESGATLYFDRGIFQSVKHSNIFYHVYTVAGQQSLGPLRKKIFAGTDGIIYVFDAQSNMLDFNIDSLKELKKFAGFEEFYKLPIITMVNKQDLPEVLKKGEVDRVLNEEGLLNKSKVNYSKTKDKIYETIALYQKERNVYSAFIEMMDLLSETLKTLPSFANVAP